MQEKIIKNFQLKNIEELDNTLGYFEADLAVYGNIDLGNEMIEHGSFGNINKDKKYPILADHITNQVIGHYFADSTNLEALKIKGYFNFNRDPITKALLVPKAGEKYANLKNGDVSGFSVGFTLGKDSYRIEEINGKEVKVYSKNLVLQEGSVVTFPMNKEAKLRYIKALNKIQNIRDAEEILKNYGFSSKNAKTMISKIKNFKEAESCNKEQLVKDKKDKRDVSLESLSNSLSMLERKLAFKEMETKLEKTIKLIK